jgi:hypothetical protein
VPDENIWGDETPPEPPERVRLEPELPLVTAASLLDDADEDVGDFEPGGRYKGFTILSEGEWPDDLPASHGKAFPGRFYVYSPLGKVGLVPWPGSVIVWPWEQAWDTDLHRDEVQSLLREEKKEKKKR